MLSGYCVPEAAEGFFRCLCSGYAFARGALPLTEVPERVVLVSGRRVDGVYLWMSDSVGVPLTRPEDALRCLVGLDVGVDLGMGEAALAEGDVEFWRCAKLWVWFGGRFDVGLVGREEGSAFGLLQSLFGGWRGVLGEYYSSGMAWRGVEAALFSMLRKVDFLDDNPDLNPRYVSVLRRLARRMGDVRSAVGWYVRGERSERRFLRFLFLMSREGCDVAR